MLNIVSRQENEYQRLMRSCSTLQGDEQQAASIREELDSSRVAGGAVKLASPWEAFLAVSGNVTHRINMTQQIYPVS